MSTIQPTPTTVGQNVCPAIPAALNKRKKYEPAMAANFAITITSAATMAQPPIQPVRGPNARLAHVKVVPASGSASFSSR